MTSYYVMVTNKLYLDDRNNDYTVLCKLGSHTISGCRVTGVGPPEPPPPGPGKQIKTGLSRVKTIAILTQLLDQILWLPTSKSWISVTY